MTLRMDSGDDVTLYEVKVDEIEIAENGDTVF